MWSERQARLAALVLLGLALTTMLVPIAILDPAVDGRRQWSALAVLQAARDAGAHRTPLGLAVSFPGLAYLFTAAAALAAALPRWRQPVVVLTFCALLSASRAWRWTSHEIAATLYRHPPPTHIVGLRIVDDGIGAGPALYLLPLLLLLVLALLFTTRRRPW